MDFSLSYLFGITKNSDRQLLVATSIIISTLIADITIIRISDLIADKTTSIDIFILISAISLIGQNLILRIIRQRARKSKTIYKNLYLNIIGKIATLVHYGLAAIILLVILQMLISSSYSTVMLIAAITISYAFSIAMTIFLGWKFLSWYKVNRNYVVLLYGLSSAMLVVNMAISSFLGNSILLTKQDVIMPTDYSHPPVIYPGSEIYILNYAYILTTIFSFIVAWSATIALLSHYSKKIGKFRYPIILTLPLAFFVSQFLAVSLNLLSPLLVSNPIFYGTLFTIIFTLTKPIGGIIFGIAFWIIARKISKDNLVRSYVIIAACGFMLLFTSNQAVVLTFSFYPPFGLATISFVGLSSYMILVGIYYSALSVSQDTEIRREIRRLAIKESKLLDIMGMAQMENEIRHRVLHIVTANKSAMEEDAGIDSSLCEDEIAQYLETVMVEIKIKKQRKGDTVA